MREVKKLSKKRITKTLRNLGLSNTQVKIYLFLAKKGPQTKNPLAKAIKLTDDQITVLLNKLLEKNLVEKTKDHYSAKPFQETIDLLVRFTFEESAFLDENKEALLTEWRALIEDSDN